MNSDLNIKWKLIPNATSTTFSALWKDEYPPWSDVYDWCNENFNSDDWHFWYEREHEYLIDEILVCAFFEFIRDEDAMAFTLRWT